MEKEPGEPFTRLAVSLKNDDLQQLHQLRLLLEAELGERISMSKTVRIAIAEAFRWHSGK